MISILVEDRFRYVILFVGCLCLTSIASNMLAFNIAQVCMGSNDTVEMENKVDLKFGFGNTDLDWTPYEISQINWAVAVGTASAAIPFSASYTKFGVKWSFFGAGILSAIATLLMPLSIELNFYALLAFRFLQGVSYAADFAAVGALCSSWASLKQNGLFLGVLTSYSPLSSGLANSMGGLICSSRFGWPLVFYFHAVFGFVVFTTWAILYTDLPQHSPKVTEIELEKIQRHKNEIQINGTKMIPYMTLITDMVIISIWASALAELFSTNFLAVYSPYYLKNVLHLDPATIGNYSAISRLVQIPVRLIAGHLSDKIKFLSENMKLIFFNTITVCGAGFVYLSIGFVPVQYPLLVLLCFSMENIVTGCASAGFYKAAVLYSRQYSHFVIATCQLFKCAVLFIGPALVAIFVKDASSQPQWRIIFLSASVTMFLASIMFCKYSSAEPAIYTQTGYVGEKDPKKLTKLIDKEDKPV